MAFFPLAEIDCVLLDLDGTLLDKYFDDYFWEHLVPEKYAEKFNVTFGTAKKELLEKYKAHEGTLNWTDLDFWSGELGLDIPAMKEQIKHLIEVHPHVVEFLQMLRSAGKKIYLVTNAHYKAIEIKFRKTGIGGYFDHVLPSYEVGAAKENLEFWEKAQKRLGFQNGRTAFIDDTAAVLRTAQEFGIKYVYLKEKAASKTVTKKEKERHDFQVVTDFKEFLII